MHGPESDTVRVDDAKSQTADRYRERGGMRWGKSFWRSGYNFTWPFATLTATAEELVLAAAFYRFAFARSEVQSVFLTSGILSIGLRVRHSRSDYPPFIVFWTFRPRRLTSALRELGYPIDNGSEGT